MLSHNVICSAAHSRQTIAKEKNKYIDRQQEDKKNLIEFEMMNSVFVRGFIRGFM